MNDTIYLVIAGEYSDWEILGYFKDIYSAELYTAQYNDGDNYHSGAYVEEVYKPCRLYSHGVPLRKHLYFVYKHGSAYTFDHFDSSLTMTPFRNIEEGPKGWTVMITSRNLNRDPDNAVRDYFYSEIGSHL